MLYFDILDKKRQGLLPRLGFLKKRNFYLAGGTALALQLAHRVSLDFDFYRKEEFDAQALFEIFQEQFAQDNLQQIQIDKNTLSVSINNIEVSLFRYKYPLIQSLIRRKYINLASAEDIGAMKIIAITQRGVRRDFIDLYFLLQRFSLNKLLNIADKKYKGFNKYLALQGLTYFENADREASARIQLLKSVSWRKVKEEIIAVVNNFKKLNLQQ